MRATASAAVGVVSKLKAMVRLYLLDNEMRFQSTSLRPWPILLRSWPNGGSTTWWKVHTAVGVAQVPTEHQFAAARTLEVAGSGLYAYSTAALHQYLQSSTQKLRCLKDK
eukprot:3022453-Prymnesium_polylepis.1